MSFRFDKKLSSLIILPAVMLCSGAARADGNSSVTDGLQVTAAQRAVAELDAAIKSANAGKFGPAYNQLHMASDDLNAFALLDPSINEATDLISQAQILADSGGYVAEGDKIKGIKADGNQAIGLIAHSPAYLAALGEQSLKIHQVSGITASYTAQTSAMSLENSVGDVVNQSACATEAALFGQFNAIRGNAQVSFGCASDGVSLQMVIEYPVSAPWDAQYIFRSPNQLLIGSDCKNAVADLESLQAQTGELGLVHAYCVKGVLEFTATIN